MSIALLANPSIKALYGLGGGSGTGTVTGLLGTGSGSVATTIAQPTLTGSGCVITSTASTVDIAVTSSAGGIVTGLIGSDSGSVATTVASVPIAGGVDIGVVSTASGLTINYTGSGGGGGGTSGFVKETNGVALASRAIGTGGGNTWSIPWLTIPLGTASGTWYKYEVTLWNFSGVELTATGSATGTSGATITPFVSSASGSVIPEFAFSQAQLNENPVDVDVACPTTTISPAGTPVAMPDAVMFEYALQATDANAYVCLKFFNGIANADQVGLKAGGLCNITVVAQPLTVVP